MWGGSSKKPLVNTTKANSVDEDLPVVQFNEADLEDPELLAELHGLIAEHPRPTKTVSKSPKSASAIPKSKTNKAEIETKLHEALTAIPADVEDVEVEFDDKDMNDPELLVSFCNYTQKPFLVIQGVE